MAFLSNCTNRMNDSTATFFREERINRKLNSNSTSRLVPARYKRQEFYIVLAAYIYLQSRHISITASCLKQSSATLLLFIAIVFCYCCR